jgi:hypothetical protein
VKGCRAASFKGWWSGSPEQDIDAHSFSSNKHSVLRVHRTIALRWATVTLAAISWLAVSNHCALGLAAIENHKAGPSAEHDCCASKAPAQPRPAKDPAAPCCKTLQASAVTPARVFQANATMVAGGPVDFATMIVAGPPLHSIVASRFLDTGPPGEGTFAESVLQRSLLAHAPPFPA